MDSLTPHLPSPLPSLYDGTGREKVYILYGGRVWSGIFSQASYDLAPPHYWEKFECLPRWDAKFWIVGIREDKLPEPPPPPVVLPWWKRGWKLYLDMLHSQTVE